MKINAKGLTMLYSQGSRTKADSFVMLPLTDFDISIEKLNFSPILNDLQFMTPEIDFEDLDFSQHINVKFTPVKLNLTQEVYTYLLRCNDLNIGHMD